MRLLLDEIESPIGQILIVLGPSGLQALDFGDHRARMDAALLARHGVVELQRSDRITPEGERVRTYFEGRLHALDDLSVDAGGTEFQRSVWSALRAVPPGRTSSYGALAQAVGRPTAARAVGAANGRNPVALVVPCHRIVGADGSLTGYAGGVERKRWLLRHEGVAHSRR